MAKHQISEGTPLPRGWPKSVKSAMLQVISLAHYAMSYTRSWAVNSPIRPVAAQGRKRTPLPTG